MKVKVVKTEPNFLPRTLTLTIESKEQADLLARIFGPITTYNLVEMAKQAGRYSDTYKYKDSDCDEMQPLISALYQAGN